MYLQNKEICLCARVGEVWINGNKNVHFFTVYVNLFKLNISVLFITVTYKHILKKIIFYVTCYFSFKEQPLFY